MSTLQELQRVNLEQMAKTETPVPESPPETDNNTTILQSDKPTNQQTNTPAPAELRRADGRTMRVRQDTADQTLVTSMRLAVSTIEALDEYCWRHRQRKQDVVQAALDLYFAAKEEI